MHGNGDIFTTPQQVTVERKRGDKIQVFKHTIKREKLSAWIGNTGYLQVSCKRNNKRPKFTVHRLIALAFVPGHFDNATVNHINGIKTDNRIENLEWVTLSKNSELEWGTGLCNTRGENQPNAKLTSKKVRIIRHALQCGLSACELATLCDVSDSLIYLIKDGKRWNSII